MPRHSAGVQQFVGHCTGRICGRRGHTVLFCDTRVGANDVLSIHHREKVSCQGGMGIAYESSSWIELNGVMLRGAARSAWHAPRSRVIKGFFN